MRNKIENSLKHFLKRRGGYTLAILISFLINNQIVFTAQNISTNLQSTYSQLDIQKNKIKARITNIQKEIEKLKQSSSTSFSITKSIEVDKKNTKLNEDNLVIGNKIPDSKPPIKIRDLITPIIPKIPIDITFPNENEELVTEPNITPIEIGNISFINIPKDITIELVPISFVPLINEKDFNISKINRTTLPKFQVSSFIDTIDSDININDKININIDQPEISDTLDIPTFNSPEFVYNLPTLTLPTTFTLNKLKLNSSGFEQSSVVGIIPENSLINSVIQNMNSYEPEGKNLNINFINNNISYTTGDYFGKKYNYGGGVILLDGKLNGQDIPYIWPTNSNATGLSLNYALRSCYDYINKRDIKSFITDLINNDSVINGNFNIKYSKAIGNESSRIFSSINPCLLGENNIVTAKVSTLNGNLSLFSDTDLKGSLVGFEHQIYDGNNITDSFLNSNSTLLNNGNINIGDKNNIGNNPNIMGVAIDIEKSNLTQENISKKKPHQFVNNGNINMYGSNDIGVSFEEYNPGLLKYNLYVGKVNLYGDSSYGLRLGNIFKNNDYYYDGVTIVGDTNSLVVKGKELTNYKSNILVQGTENIGINIEKSVSSKKSSNPISNFKNINLELNGDKTIGLLRGKNYSSNNTNDFIIDSENFSNLSFGNNATNSVLLRTEMYGITLNRDLEISSTTNNQKNNVVLQGVAQTWTNEKGEKINSAGSITNNGNIFGNAKNLIGMMVSGTIDSTIQNWQNNSKLSKAKAVNNGKINFTGSYSAGMAILDNNVGENNGTIQLNGDNNIAVVNQGDFELNSNSSLIEVSGTNSIAITNTGNLNINGGTIEATSTESDVLKGSMGIFSENGKITFNNKPLLEGKNSGAVGFYSKKDNSINGDININNFKIGVISEDGNLSVDGNVSYSGNGFALFTKNDGKISFSKNSSLTLGGNAYGFTIDGHKIGTTGAIDFNGSNINIISPNVTIFNVVATQNDSFSTKQKNTNEAVGINDLKKYVGDFNIISNVSNYRIANIDGGIINFDGSEENNIKFLEKYRFQGNQVNVTTPINMVLNNQQANQYFNNEVIGISLNSSPNLAKAKNSEGVRDLSQLNINSTIEANRLENSPLINGKTKSTIGAYIDYGKLTLGDSGVINVEKPSANDVVNNNGIGIYAKDGSNIITNSGSSINVFGNGGIGIYSISSVDNKYGFSPLPLSITNNGNINLNGNDGVGIYADNENTKKGDVVNNGIINIGNEDGFSNIGIFSNNNNLTNNGEIFINSQNFDTKDSSVGIYALNSNVTIGENSSIALGEKSSGIILKDGSDITVNGTLSFKDNEKIRTPLDKISKISKNGIIFNNGKNNSVNYNIDISDVVAGKGVILKNCNLDVAKNSNISVSGVNGKGIKILDGTLNSSGTITLEKEKIVDNQPFDSAIGIVATNTSGNINNSGIINVNSKNGIGIYMSNLLPNGNNQLLNMGTINQNAQDSIGLVLKNVDFTFNKNSIFNMADNISAQGVFASNGSKLTLNDDFTPIVGQGNIFAVAIGNQTQIIDNSNINLNKKDSIGFYLKNGAAYLKNNNYLTLSNGATGIYSSTGNTNINNFKINLANGNNSSIGVILDGLFVANKNINGEINFLGKGNDIGVVGRTTNIVIPSGKSVDFNYNNNSGTAIYLDSCNLSGGEININGNSLENGTNTVAIYYDSNLNATNSIKDLTLNINKNHTVGNYINNGQLNCNETINIGKNGKINNVAGIFIDESSSLNFTGNINLSNSTLSSGLVAMGRNLTNAGNVTIENNSGNIGILLNENTTFDGKNGSVTIKGSSISNNQKNIGIYTNGENIKINDFGKLNIDKGNIAIFSHGTSINSDINIFNKDNIQENQEIVALMAKSSSNNPTIIGGNDKLMNVTLAKNSVGIIALDSGVKLQNLGIDMTLANTNTEKNSSFGIVLSGDEKDNHYILDNININGNKGSGITLNCNGNSSATISNSTFTFNSKENDKIKGIAIITQKGDNIISNNNKFNLNSSYGIYGNSCNINVGQNSTFNLSGNSIGIYANGTSNIEIDNSIKANITGNSSGTFAYLDSGTLNNNGNILSTGLLNNFNALIAQNGNINNSGDITLSGNKVFGIISSEKANIINKGNINISGNNQYSDNSGFSFGIFSHGGNINNTGKITIGNSGVGIGYSGNYSDKIASGNINLIGENSIGMLLNSSASNSNISSIDIDDITSNKDTNLAIYLNGYNVGQNSTIGNIEMMGHSAGIYLNNSSFENLTINNIKVANNSVGFTSLNSNIVSNVAINNMSVGNHSIGFYVDNAQLNLQLGNVDNILQGKEGALFSVRDNGKINLKLSSPKLIISNNIGIILNNKSSITSNVPLDEIDVKNGGTGLVVKGARNSYSSLINDKTKLVVGSGSLIDKDNGVMSVGAYFKDSDVFKNGNTLNIQFEKPLENNSTEFAIGSVLNNTYGKVDAKLLLNNYVKNSIGIFANNSSNTTTAEEVVFNSNDNNLVDILGNSDIGIVGENTNITTNGNINIVENSGFTPLYSIGVSLQSTQDNFNNKYMGNGDISIGGTNIGINSIGYDIVQNGNINVTGKSGIGMSNINKFSKNNSINLQGNLKIQGEEDTGIFTYNTDVISKGNLNILGDNSIGIFSMGNGNIDMTFENLEVGGNGSIGLFKEKKAENANGIIAESQIVTKGGNINVTGRNFGMMTKNTTSKDIKIENGANITLDNNAIGIYTVGKTNLYNGGEITVGKNSRGLYMANGNASNSTVGINKGNINIVGNGGVGIQSSGYVDFFNNGNINITTIGNGIGAFSTSGATIINEIDGNIKLSGKYSTGMLAKFTNTQNATVINKGNIDILNFGTGMMALGKGAIAINRGNITLNQNKYYINRLIGMSALNGGTIINDTAGKIIVNNGVGMAVDKKSTFENRGTIVLKEGVGILGDGITKNQGGTIIIKGGGNPIYNTSDNNLKIDEGIFNNFNNGSLEVDRSRNIARLNDNFINIGGKIQSDVDVVLNNPTIDITKGEIGIVAPSISGEIKLDSNFALKGNGLHYEFKQIIHPNTHVKINTSPLFNVEIDDQDVFIDKLDYRYITSGDDYDIRDNSLDDIIKHGGEDAEKLKALGFYLDSLGNTPAFRKETDRIFSQIGGSIYENVQDRINDINRAFDNSFDNMYFSQNKAYSNNKFDLINITGKRRYKDNLYTEYKYTMTGLNFMKEWENKNRKYGYELGFLVSDFKFKNSNSKERVYSIEGGVHNKYNLPYDFDFFTKVRLTGNYHKDKNEITFSNTSIRNRGNYSTYSGNLENILNYNILNKEENRISIYGGSNIGYAYFDGVSEKGDFALKVKSNNYFSNQLLSGIKGDYLIPMIDNWQFILNGKIEMAHEFKNLKNNQAKFKDINSPYWSLIRLPQSKDTISIKGSLGVVKDNNFNVKLSSELSQDFRKDNVYWNVGLSISAKF